MIKFIVLVLVVLALIGGAVQFQTTEAEWALVVNKEAALSSIQNGAMIVYDFANELIADADQIQGVDLSAPTK